MGLDAKHEHQFPDVPAMTDEDAVRAEDAPGEADDLKRLLQRVSTTSAAGGSQGGP